MSISEFVRTIKSNSSKYMHETYNVEFNWQIGYAIYSVSKSNTQQVMEYIKNQEEHHKKVDYQEEFNKFLTVHGYQIINEHK
jgi:putative transposase